MRKISILFLYFFLYANIIAQGEYFRNGESGITVGRFFVLNEGNKAQAVGVGLSYYGRADFSIVQDDRYTLFDDRNSYSITGHILKQETKKKNDPPFSLAISLSQSRANIRSYSIFLYRMFDLQEYVKLLIEAGYIAAGQLSYINASEYQNFYPLGLSLLGNPIDKVSIGIAGSMVISKVTPTPGYQIAFIVVYDLHK